MSRLQLEFVYPKQCCFYDCLEIAGILLPSYFQVVNTGGWGVVNTVDPRLCSRVSVEYVKFLIPEVHP